MTTIPPLSYLEKLLLIKLNENGATIRSDLVKLVNFPRTTLHDNLKKLQSWGLVIKYSEHRYRRGRPLVYFCLTELGTKKVKKLTR